MSHQWISVKSSCIKELSFDEQSRVIRVRFKGGHDVFIEVINPRVNASSLFTSFLSSSSKGAFFNTVIKKGKKLLNGQTRMTKKKN